ncbi:MAG TPA: glycosyltransferase [Coleofasciculaceae cyanobacterium]|jgi:glycosyltransferase involved in cell wall biosynthesis
MAEKPLASIIIIFLNGDRFIQEALDSILAQTYDNWELLLVDDGSTDRSTEITKNYVEKYPEKIRYLEHEGHQNLGMSASRNLGINNARGEYIGFLDCDDLWTTQKLEQQIAILETYPQVALVGGRTKWWYSWTKDHEDQNKDFLQKFNLPLNTIIQPPDLLLLFLQDEWASLCDILVRRSCVEAVGGYEVSFRGMYEDQAFHAKLCSMFPAFLSSECWYIYRQHPQACCSVSHATGKTQIAKKTMLNWLEEYLSQQDKNDPQLEETVQKLLRSYRYPFLTKLFQPVRSRKRRMKNQLRRIAALKNLLRGQFPPVGWVNFGSFNKLTPLSRDFGYDRGLPIDRYYIEKFLAYHGGDIQGRVLEIGDDSYTKEFGGKRVTTRDVMHVKEGNPLATFVGDLTNADCLPSDTFDCFILTQTLHLVYDFRLAMQTIYRILKPGGVVLLTVPGISQLATDEWSSYWCWSFTSYSTQHLFEEFFPLDCIQVEVHGNVKSAIAFLQGLCTAELSQKELDYKDPCYPLLITVRAEKPKGI